MTNLTPLHRAVRRRVVIDGNRHEITLDADSQEIVLRKLHCRVEFRLPFAALLETTDIPLFAQEHVREQGRKQKRQPMRNRA